MILQNQDRSIWKEDPIKPYLEAQELLQELIEEGMEAFRSVLGKMFNAVRGMEWYQL